MAVLWENAYTTVQIKSKLDKLSQLSNMNTLYFIMAKHESNCQSNASH